MKKCTRCGAEARDDDRFCIKCFSALPETTHHSMQNSHAMSQSERIKLILSDGIHINDKVPFQNIPQTYNQPKPINKTKAINTIREAYEIFTFFEDTNPQHSQIILIKAGLGNILCSLENGSIPPLTNASCILIAQAAAFLFEMLNALANLGESSDITDNYYAVYKILSDISINGIEGDLKSNSSPNRPSGKDNSDKRTSGTIWHPDVEDDIIALEQEINKDAPKLKIHPYEEGHDYWQDLEDLIGLDSVKSCLREHIVSFQVHNIRKKKHPDLKSDFKFNCIFKGKPGTGKTTVARILAGILRNEGIIKCGHCVEADITGLTSGWVGVTPKCTKLAALKAVGGVLFIDEAYTLESCNHKSTGSNEVIDTLTPILSTFGGELIVVMAGYDKEMNRMLNNVNQGFASRFQKDIQFSDYNYKEMFEIFISIAEKNYYKLEKAAIERLLGLLQIIESRKDSNPSFANGRTVNALFEAIRNKASRRFMENPNEDPDMIISDDIVLSEKELAAIGAI